MACSLLTQSSSSIFNEIIPEECVQFNRRACLPFTKASVSPPNLLTSCSTLALWSALSRLFSTPALNICSLQHFIGISPAPNVLLIPPLAFASAGSWISSHLAAPCFPPAPWLTPAPAWPGPPPTLRPGALPVPANTFSAPALPSWPTIFPAIFPACWPLALALLAGTPAQQ